ncbi:MAG: tetraacyldisaccharide 4'-kinase, partial [Clostridia bacterium]|nr:tetraacyldisaccharide 4'-kinase [Clostridia bacterium]
MYIQRSLKDIFGRPKRFCFNNFDFLHQAFKILNMNFIDIISGKNKGSLATLMRLFLVVPSILYSFIIRLRNFGYNIGLLKVNKFDIPIICVGNLTAGGTGKTPMVIWLCQYLQKKGYSTALLSRGYKGDSDGTNDEMRLLEDSLGSTRFYINSDRVASAQLAIDEGAMAIVMDDGYQHRSLGRSLDILMIDGLCPFGYHRILPAGLLREPISGAKRAGVAVISRADVADSKTIDQAK